MRRRYDSSSRRGTDGVWQKLFTTAPSRTSIVRISRLLGLPPRRVCDFSVSLEISWGKRQRSARLESSWTILAITTALSLLEEGIVLRRALNDRRGISASLNNLGLIAVDRGERVLGLRHFMECLSFNQSLGDKSAYAMALNNVGFTIQRLGNIEIAVRMHERALRVWEEMGDRRGVARSLRNLARTSLSAGDYVRGADLARQAATVYESLGDVFDVAHALWVTADIAQAGDEPAKAVDQLVKAIDLF